jgi:hypothetical protein
MQPGSPVPSQLGIPHRSIDHNQATTALGIDRTFHNVPSSGESKSE